MKGLLRRTLGPAGPCLVLFNIHDGIVCSLPCKPKRVGPWLRQDPSPADRKRMARHITGEPEPGLFDNAY